MSKTKYAVCDRIIVALRRPYFDGRADPRIMSTSP